MIEKRTYRRDDLMEIVHYAPPPHTSDDVLRGLIKDYSDSGLCLIAHQAIEEGQEIVVKSVVMPKSKTAVVRWHRDLGNSTFKIGLEFKR